MHLPRVIGVLPLVSFFIAAPGAPGPAEPNVKQIVERSVARTDADWKAAPQYTFTERDVIDKNGRISSHTDQVLMIDGSPYYKRIAVDGEPLSLVDQAAEERKLRRETMRRRKETAGQRQKRIAEYERGRKQDHALMREMTNAFQFHLTGEEMVNGHKCFVLEATPKPGYQPPTMETKVLTGMRGKMWIDTAEYQWVKVHAEVFRPVAFGLFVAHVQPGTEFTLEQSPVGDGIWLPSHFGTHVRAEVLFWQRRSGEQDTFTNYRHSGS